MIKHVLTLIWNKKRANALLFSEIFLCFLVLFAVMMFTIYNLRTYRTPYGFEPKQLWRASLYQINQMDSLQVIEVHDQLLRDLREIPGVRGTAFGGPVAPFGYSMWGSGNDDNGYELWTSMMQGDENFGELLEIEMSEGRWFRPEDRLRKYKPIIINRIMREEYFGDKPVIDSIIKIDGEVQIIGVVDHFKYQSDFQEELNVTFWFPEPHETDLQNLYLRVDPSSGPELEETIKNRIAAIIKTQDFKIYKTDELRESIARETWTPMVGFLLIAGFLLVNIALGLFGVLYYSISKRRGEIGIRRALGATRGEITSQFTLEVFLVAMLAVLLGSVFAVQVPLLGLVEEVPSSNFYLAILAAAGIIGVIVLICAIQPSRQAAGLHPADALHSE